MYLYPLSADLLDWRREWWLYTRAEADSVDNLGKNPKNETSDYEKHEPPWNRHPYKTNEPATTTES